MAAAELARLNAALQVELVAIKAETTAKVTSLEDTIANLAHDDELRKRRLYGNKTERSHTSELQLAMRSRRRARHGEPYRSNDYSGTRWRYMDLPALGWRHRRHYDMRATFITLAIEDGADPDVIETRGAAPTACAW